MSKLHNGIETDLNYSSTPFNELRQMHYLSLLEPHLYLLIIHNINLCNITKLYLSVA